jgi:hypothetical protein
MLDLIRIQKELNITIHPDDVEVFTKLTNDFCYSIPIISYDSYNDAIDVEITKIYNTDQSLIVKKECCDIDDEIYPNSYLFIAEDDDDVAIIYDSVSRKVFYGSGDFLLVNTLKEFLDYIIYPSVIEFNPKTLLCDFSHYIPEEHFQFSNDFELNNPIVNGLLAEDCCGNKVLINGPVYLLIHDEEAKYRSIKLFDSLEEFQANTLFYDQDYLDIRDAEWEKEWAAEQLVYEAEQEKLRQDPKHLPDCSIHITQFIKQLGKPRVVQKYNKSGEYQLTQAYIDGSITKEEFILLGEITETYASLQ